MAQFFPDKISGKDINSCTNDDNCSPCHSIKLLKNENNNPITTSITKISNTNPDMLFSSLIINEDIEVQKNDQMVIDNDKNNFDSDQNSLHSFSYGNNNLNIISDNTCDDQIHNDEDGNVLGNSPKIDQQRSDQYSSLIEPVIDSLMASFGTDLQEQKQNYQNENIELNVCGNKCSTPNKLSINDDPHLFEKRKQEVNSTFFEIKQLDDCNSEQKDKMGFSISLNKINSSKKSSKKILSSNSSIKKRKTGFLSNIISNSYYQRWLEFNKLFQKHEILISDFNCYFNGLQGRIYISKNHFAFHYNFIGLFVKNLIWNRSDIVSITKANNFFFPNAIQIIIKSSSLSLSNENKEINEQKYLFTFYQRDKTFALMETVWKQSLSNQEIFNIVHKFYGEDLGFNSNEEELKFFFNDHNTYWEKTMTNHLSTIQNQESLISSTMATSSPSSSLSPNNSNSELSRSHSSTTSIHQLSTNSMDQFPKSKQFQNQSLNCPTKLEFISESITDKIISEDNDDINAEQNNIDLSSPLSKSSNKFCQSNSMYLEEGSCRCLQHRGTLIIEQVLQFPIDYLFELLFIDDNFFRYLHQTRKTTGLKINSWMSFDEKDRPVVPIPDGDYDITRCEYRTMKYIVKLNGLPLVKSSTVIENQYILQSNSSRAYCLLSQIKNQGIPHADSFMASSTWCLSSCLPLIQPGNDDDDVSFPLHTKLVIHFDIHYIKSSISLSLIKPSIEKNSIQGFKDFINDMLQLLKTNRFGQISQFILLNESCSNASEEKHVEEKQSVSDDINITTTSNDGSKDSKSENLELMVDTKSVDETSFNENSNHEISNNGIMLIKLLFDFVIGFILDFLLPISDSSLVKIVSILLLIIIIINMSLLRHVNNVETHLALITDLIEEFQQAFRAPSSSTPSTLIFNAENVSEY